MSVREISVTAIDFDRMKPEEVFKWLELFGFNRYVEKNWIVPSKSVDPRMPEGHVSTTPEGLFHSMIVPFYYYGETMFIIRQSEYDRIKETFLKAMKK